MTPRQPLRSDQRRSVTGLTTEEEAQLRRESDRMVKDPNRRDGAWSNWTMSRVLATLAAERARLSHDAPAEPLDVDDVAEWLDSYDGRLNDIFGLWVSGKRDVRWAAEKLVAEGHIARLSPGAPRGDERLRAAARNFIESHDGWPDHGVYCEGKCEPLARLRAALASDPGAPREDERLRRIEAAARALCDPKSPEQEAWANLRAVLKE